MTSLWEYNTYYLLFELFVEILVFKIWEMRFMDMESEAGFGLKPLLFFIAIKALVHVISRQSVIAPVGKILSLKKEIKE